MDTPAHAMLLLSIMVLSTIRCTAATTIRKRKIGLGRPRRAFDSGRGGRRRHEGAADAV